MTLALIANRGLHKRPGGWSPKQLGTLSLWLDADDATTITISTGVSQWDDKSGNGYNFSQGTGANQPTWTKGAQNGRAVLTFDGSNDRLEAGDILDPLTGGFSLMVAAKATNSGDIISKAAGATTTTQGLWALFSSFRFNQTAANSSIAVYTASSNFIVAGGVADRTNGNTTYLNGSQANTTATASGTSMNTGNLVYIGQRYSSAANYLNGDIAEIVLSLATWSTGDREKVEGYLAHKWGTTASLPSGHPYKSAAP